MSIFVGSKSPFPSKKSMTSCKFSTPYTFSPSTIAASFTFCLGRKKPKKPSSLALIAMGKAPRIGCKLPSSDNSPMIMYLSMTSDLICDEANKIPIAKVKS